VPPHGHRYWLALILALAYLLVIVYASLQPLRGWREPPQEMFAFLLAPWPRYITFEDVTFNVAAYAPLGFALTLALRARLTPVAGVVAGTLISALLSVAMECTQMYLPARIASNIDVLANSAGALIGSLAAPLFSTSWIIGGHLIAARDYLFRSGAAIDTGVIIVALWMCAHLNPEAQLFSTGNLRATFDLPVYIFHTPGRLVTAEAAVVFFNLLGIALLVSVLTRAGYRRWVVVAGVIGGAIALKAAVTLTLDEFHHAFTWLTPGVAIGLVLGAALLAALFSLGESWRLVFAAVFFLVAFAAINLAPDNPYFTPLSQLAMGRPSHVLSFLGILRALSDLWPLLALSYLAWARARSGKANRI
jgi:VanZ family protein